MLSRLVTSRGMHRRYPRGRPRNTLQVNDFRGRTETLRTATSRTVNPSGNEVPQGWGVPMEGVS